MSDPSGGIAEPIRPGPWLRRFYRAPVWLFRARLGWVFGNRFLLLTHRGRRTGRLRQTVLEVVRFDPDRPEWTVVSGHGTLSDWFRNLAAGSAVRVDVGFRGFVPDVRLLDETERRALLTAYQRAHPRAARQLGHRLLGLGFNAAETSIEDLARVVPALGFRPRAEVEDGGPG